MAGEWLSIDIAAPDKPEMQELVDLTGEPIEVVFYRVFKLWGWASLNSDDGTVRTTPERLGRTCGGDGRFWLAVETVGWIRFAEDGTAEIPGWGRRFSQSAKSRALHLERAGRARQANADGAPKRSKSARDECAQAQQKRTREEEKTDSSSSSPVVVDPVMDGATLRAAWNQAARQHPNRVRPHGDDDLPEATVERLKEPGWLAEALKAIERLPACRFFSSPVNLAQFSGKPGGRRFTRKVLEHQFDNPRESRGGPRAQEDRRPASDAAAEWSRGATDPEAARRRQEYLEAKARKAAGASLIDQDDDLEAARAAVLAKLREV